MKEVMYKKIASDAQTKLLLNLRRVRRQMELKGFNNDAVKMQKVIDMAIEQDITTNLEICEAIGAKCKELRPL